MNHVDDPLLQCLLALCRYHGNASTAEAVMGGLPAHSGNLTPGLFERAAGRVGLASRLVYRSPEEIEPALLPAVVMLKNERACLLLGWKSDGAFARVIYPELNESVVDVPREELLASSEDAVIVCRPRFKFDQRAPRTGTSERGHWFWDAIARKSSHLSGCVARGVFYQCLCVSSPAVHDERV